MECNQCEGIENSIGDKIANFDLKRYRKKGAGGFTKVLLDTLKAAGVEGMRLLDIGGGVGAIQHALLQAGVSRATSVDASSAYLKASQEEAERLGHADRLTQHFGDFVDMASEIEEAELVTLDKVLCCFDNMKDLVRLSAEHASKFYALIYPKDKWWVKAMNNLENIVHSVRRSQFRSFIHATDSVDAIGRAAGLKPYFRSYRFYWQIVIYQR